MHKKRNYRRRVREDSESEEESSSTEPLDSTASKLTTLSFDDALESDIAFVPRAPMTKPGQDKLARVANVEINKPKKEDSAELEDADSRMTLQSTENRGYAVFAKTNITAGKARASYQISFFAPRATVSHSHFVCLFVGQTLIKEAPYGAVIDEANITKYCSSCFKSSDQPLSRCSLCKQLYYCSRQCQTNDWKLYHSIECPSFTKIGKSVPTAIRCLTRILINRANAPSSYSRLGNLASRAYIMI
jgi:MYND finger